MAETGRAFFVKQPRNIDELKVPHLIENETTYFVVKQLTLSLIEYENFVTDLKVEREYLEKNAALCIEHNDNIECLLIQTKGSTDGLLVLPDAGGLVNLVAYSEG